MTKVKVKKAVEVPPNIQSFITKVISTPADRIAEALQEFTWQYDKGDFNHWIALFNHFDAYFEEHVAKRGDLTLKFSSDQSDPPFPHENVLAVLKTTTLILENCSNKHLYGSTEHLASLLAAPHPETVTATLRTLVAFLRKTHHNNVRWHGNHQLNSRLLSLCRGWGGKEEGLDLTACASSDEAAVKSVLPQCTTLHFEFFSDPSPTGGESVQTGGVQKLHLASLEQYKESEHDILKELVLRYNVPENHRFELLSRIRIAKNFASLQGRRQLVEVRLLAFYVVFQSHPVAEEVLSLFTSEPEFVTELVALVQQEETVPENLRILALRCLAVQLLDRSRHSSVITAITAGGQSGLLAMLLHKSVASVVAQGSSSTTAAAAQPAGSDAPAAARPSEARPSEARPSEAGTEPTTVYSSQFVEALLSLVGALVASTSGCSALADAGIISALLPLLRDLHPDHVNLVASTVKILEAYMDFSQAASTMFRDLGGLTDMIDRLCIEVGVDPATASQPGSQPAAQPPAADAASGEAAEPLPPPSGTVVAAPATPTPAAAQDTVKQLPYARRLLLRFLLRAIALASYAPSNGAGTRPSDSDTQKLYKCLEALFSRPAEFGGGLFSLAANVMTDLIHHDPLCFRSIDEAGLPQAFLSTIKAGAVTTQDAVTCIPNTLAAMCLNTGGLRQVQEAKALHTLIPICTSKKFLKALSSDAPSVLGAALEELFRFVPLLREEGIQVIVSVFRALCILGGDEEETAALKEAQAAAAAAAAAVPPPPPPDVPAAAPAPSEQGLAPMESEDAATAAASAAGPTGGAAGAAAPAEDDVEPMDTDIVEAVIVGVVDRGGTTVLPSPVPPGAPVRGRRPRRGSSRPHITGAAGRSEEEEEEAGGPTGEPVAAPAADVEMAAAAPQPEVEAATVEAQGAGPSEDADESEEVSSPRQLFPLAAEIASAVTAARESGMESHLPECINHATRMLEALLQNIDTSKLFVEKGGVDLLLKLHTLPKLHPSFSFSSASHPLLAAFRTISPSHADTVSIKARDVLAKQLEELLPRAVALRSVCVPTLPEGEREEYVRRLTATAGLIGVGSAVARNASNMLLQVSMGTRPVIAKMGELERAVMQQMWVAEQWKVTQPPKPQDEKTPPSMDTPATPSLDALAEAPLDGLAEDSGVDADVPPLDGDMLPDVTDADGEPEGEGEGDGHAMEVALGQDAVAARPAAETSPKPPKPRKKTGEEIAYDVLDQFCAMVRSFYTAVAKSIHTPARRRDDNAAQPSNAMRAAAVNMALVFRANLAWEWEQPEDLAPAVRAKCQASYLSRLGQQLHAVLFDNRRRSCQSLILNYFMVLSGMQAATTRFREAAQLMWDAMEMEAAEKSAAASAAATSTAAPTTAGAVASAAAPAGPVPEAGPSTSASGDDAAMTDAAAAPPAAGSPPVPEAREVRVAAEKAVLWFLSVYEQLSNVAMILQSPQASTLLIARMPAVPGVATREPAKDTTAFIKDIQSEILAAVVPIWAHPRLSDCSSPVLNTVVNILSLCASSPATSPSLARQAAQRPLNQRPVPPIDPHVVQQIVDMGFTAARAEEALRRVGVAGVPRVEAAMDWLFTHPDEPEPRGRPTVEPPDYLDLSAAVAPSVAAIARSEKAAAAAATGGTAAAGGTTPAEVPGAAQLVEGAVSLLQKRPGSSFAVADLLVTVAQQEVGRERPALVEHLVKAMAAGFEAVTAADPVQAAGEKSMQAFIPVQLFLMVLSSDPYCREVAGKFGVAEKVLGMLETWESRYRARIESVASGPELDEAQQREVYQVPVWVEALLLLLEILTNVPAKTNVLANIGPRNPLPYVPSTPEARRALAAATASAEAEAAAAAAAAATAAEAATAAVATAPSSASQAVDTAAAAGGGEPPAAATAVPAPPAGGDAVMATDAAPAGGSAPRTEDQVNVAPASVPMGPDLQDALKSWRPCGLLTDDEQRRAATVSLALLQHLHAHAGKWAVKDPLATERDPSIPSPASTIQALLQLLARITRTHSVALQVHTEGAVRLLLSLPPAILSCNFTRLEPHITAIIRHILEDHATLKAWMESEIKNLLTSRGRARDVFGARNPFRSDSIRNPFRQDTGRSISINQLLSMMARVVSRDPFIFLEALVDTCTLETGSGSDDFLVALKKAKDEKQAGGGAAGVAPAQADATAPRPAEAGAAAPMTPAPPARPAAGAATTGGEARRSDEGGAPKLNASVAEHATPAPDTKHKSALKTPRTTKKVPSTIVEVLDFLLEVLMGFKATPPPETKPTTDAPGSMDLDPSTKPEGTPTPAAPLPAPLPEPAPVPAGPSAVPIPPHPVPIVEAAMGNARSGLSRLFGGPLGASIDARARAVNGRDGAIANAAAAAASLNSMTADMLKQLESIPHSHLIQMLVLKMLTEFCLLFGSTVGFLLKRDHESAVRVGRKGVKVEHVAGGVLKQVMHHHLLVIDPGLIPSVAEHTSQFLQAICIRSVEGRRRIVHEIVSTLTAGINMDMDPADRELALAPAPAGRGMSQAYKAIPGEPSPVKVPAFVNLVSCLVHTPSPHAPPEPRNQNQIGLSHEMIRTMRDAGMVRALTHAMNLVNLDNPRAAKALNAVLKPLEVLTRVPLAVPKSAGGSAAGPAPAAAEPGGGGEATGNGAAVPHEAGDAAGTAGGPAAGGTGAAVEPGPRDVRMEEPDHGFEAAAAGPDAMAMLGGGAGMDEMVMYGPGRPTMAEVMEQLMEAMQDDLTGEDMDDEDEDGDNQHLGSDEEHEHGHDDDDDDDEDEDSQGGSEDGVPLFRLQLGGGDMVQDEDEDEDGEGSEDEDEDGVGSGSDEDHPLGGDLHDTDEEEAADHVIEAEEEDLEAGGDEDQEEEEEGDGDEDDEDDDILPGADDMDDVHELNEGASEDTLLLEEYEDDDEEALELMGDAGRRSWTRTPHLSNLLVDLEFDPYEVLNRMPAVPQSNDFMDVLDDMLASMPGMAGARHNLQPRSRFRIITMDQARERSANPFMPPATLLPNQHRLLTRPSTGTGLGSNPALYPPMPHGTTTAPDGSLVMRFDGANGSAWRRVNFPNLPLQNILGHQGASLLQAMVEDLTTGRGTGHYPDLNAYDLDFEPLFGPGSVRAEPRSPFRGAGAVPGTEETGLDIRALEAPLLGHLQRLNPGVTRGQRAPMGTAAEAAAMLASAAVEAGVATAATQAMIQEAAAQLEQDLAEPAVMEDADVRAVEAPATDAPRPEAQPSAEAPAPPPSTSTPAPALVPPQPPSSTAPPASAVAAALQAALDAALSQQTLPGAEAIMNPPDLMNPESILGAEPLINSSAGNEGVQPELQQAGSLRAHPIQPSRAETDADEADEASPMDTEDLPRSGTVSMEDAQAASGGASPGPERPDSQPESSAPPESAPPPPPADQAGEPAGDGSTLSPELCAAAEAAGIDITFLEALPPDLRAEVLAAANPHATTASTPPLPAGDELQLMEGLDPEVLAALPPDIQQEVLAQQRVEQRRQQAAQQQAAAAAAQQQQQHAAGDLENDWATILENSAPDVRDDLLLGANEDFLSRLPSDLAREARELRERHFRHLRDPMPPAGLSRAFNMFPHGRRMQLAPSDGRGPARLMPLPLPLPLDKPKEEVEGPPQMTDDDVMVVIQLLKVPQPILKTQLQKLLGNLCNHSATRSVVLKALLGMLQANCSAAGAPAAAGQGPDDFTSMETEEPSTAAAQPPAADASLASALDQLAATPAAPPAVTAPVGLPVGGPAVAGPAGQTCSQVVRRVLDALIYLAKHNQKVALLMLSLELSAADLGQSGAGPAGDNARGKGKAVADGTATGLHRAVELLLGVLGQPVCQRSSGIMEQTLQLLEVVLQTANKQLQQVRDAASAAAKAAAAEKEVAEAAAKAEASAAATATAPADATAMTTSDAAPAPVTTEGTTPAPPPTDTPAPELATATAVAPDTAETAAPAVDAAADGGDAAAPPAGGAAAAITTDPVAGPAAAAALNQAVAEMVTASMAALAKVEAEIHSVLGNIPSSLLRQLPVLLGREGLSELAYTRIGTLIKVIVSLDPSHTPLILDQVTTELCRVGEAVTQSLCRLQTQPNLEADGALLTTIAVQGGMLLRMLHAVDGLSKQQDSKDKDAAAASTQATGTATSAELRTAPSTGTAAGTTGRPTAASSAGASVAAGPAGGSGAGTGSSSVRSDSGVNEATATGPSSASVAATGGARQAGSSAGVSSSGAGSSAGPSAFVLAQAPSGSRSGSGALATTSAAAVQVPKVVPTIAKKLEPLWKALSTTISLVEQTLKASTPDRVDTSAASRILPQGATQVMPLVEAFFVLCNLQGAVPPAPTNNSRDASTLRTPAAPLRLQPSDPAPPTPSATHPFLPPTPTGAHRTPSAFSTPLPTPTLTLPGPVSAPAADPAPSPHVHTAFTRFAERHKRMLNAYLRRSPQLLEGSLAPLLHVPKLIDFDNKRAYFRTKVRSEDRAHHHHFSLRLNVRRDHVFEDSFHALRDKTSEQLKGKLTVSFRGEEGIDAGGVSREWYQIMAREIFNPNTALFVQVPEGGTTFQPNPNSVVQTERHYDHLDFFRFVGKLVGKALYDGQLMDAYFTRSFYKHMLGLPITYEDIEAVDPAYFKTLKWMLENDITGILDLTFTAETDFFGKKEIVELTAGGKDVRVTEENKLEYVNLIARHHMTTAIRSQIEAFLQGFWDLIPRKLISMFNDHELELLISGLPDIDIDDLRANTDYTGFTAATPVIQWFWELVRDMDKQDLALLLQFVTGTSKVPLEGFKALQGISGPQKFQIHKAYVSSNRLPSAHTCFNQLDLPEYETKEQLTERLMVAIHEGSEGFGFG